MTDLHNNSGIVSVRNVCCSFQWRIGGMQGTRAPSQYKFAIFMQFLEKNMKNNTPLQGLVPPGKS